MSQIPEATALPRRGLPNLKSTIRGVAIALGLAFCVWAVLSVRECHAGNFDEARDLAERYIRAKGANDFTCGEDTAWSDTYITCVVFDVEYGPQALDCSPLKCEWRLP